MPLLDAASVAGLPRPAELLPAVSTRQNNAAPDNYQVIRERLYAQAVVIDRAGILPPMPRQDFDHGQRPARTLAHDGRPQINKIRGGYSPGSRHPEDAGSAAEQREA